MSLVDVGQEDVLEVPGTSVGKITFGPTNLSIPTNAGVYAFTNVTYADPLSSYSAAVDPVTGLMAITFSDVDVFQRNVPASSGRLSGDYLWSNPANWSGNVPVDGDDVSIGADGYDDLAALKLATLTLDAAGDAVVHVTGESLTVAKFERIRQRWQRGAGRRRGRCGRAGDSDSATGCRTGRIADRHRGRCLSARQLNHLGRDDRLYRRPGRPGRAVRDAACHRQIHLHVKRYFRFQEASRHQSGVAPGRERW